MCIYRFNTLSDNKGRKNSQEQVLLRYIKEHWNTIYIYIYACVYMYNKKKRAKEV